MIKNLKKFGINKFFKKIILYLQLNLIINKILLY